jgi:hypothetical protein
MAHYSAEPCHDLIHGCFTTRNLVFDLNHRIQMTDFLSNLSERAKREFSNEGWNPATDVPGFASLLFQIIVGRPASDEVSVPADLPMFVSHLIEAGLSGESKNCLHSGIFLRF